MYLEINNLYKGFGEADSRVEVLKDISFGVEKGEICVIYNNLNLIDLNDYQDILNSKLAKPHIVLDMTNTDDQNKLTVDNINNLNSSLYLQEQNEIVFVWVVSS